MKKLFVLIMCSIMLLSFGCIQIVLPESMANTTTSEKQTPAAEPTTTAAQASTVTPDNRKNENGAFWFSELEFEKEYNEQLIKQGLTMTTENTKVIDNQAGKTCRIVYKNIDIAGAGLMKPSSSSGIIDQAMIAYPYTYIESYGNEITLATAALILTCDPTLKGKDEALEIVKKVIELELSGIHEYVYNGIKYLMSVDGDYYGLYIRVLD